MVSSIVELSSSSYSFSISGNIVSIYKKKYFTEERNIHIARIGSINQAPMTNIISSGIRQKGESQNGCFKKAKHAKISEKQNISYPLIRTRMCSYQEVRNVYFSEILACFAFLKHPT